MDKENAASIFINYNYFIRRKDKQKIQGKYHCGYLVLCIEKQKQSGWLVKMSAAKRRP